MVGLLLGNDNGGIYIRAVCCRARELFAKGMLNADARITYQYPLEK